MTSPKDRSEQNDQDREGLVQVGWILSDDMMAEFDVTPLDDEYFTSLGRVEADGGIQPKYAARLIPVYRVDGAL